MLLRLPVPPRGLVTARGSVPVRRLLTTYARLSQLLVPTTREPPQDALLDSHQVRVAMPHRRRACARGRSTAGWRRSCCIAPALCAWPARPACTHCCRSDNGSSTNCAAWSRPRWSASSVAAARRAARPCGQLSGAPCCRGGGPSCVPPCAAGSADSASPCRCCVRRISGGGPVRRLAVPRVTATRCIVHRAARLTAAPIAARWDRMGAELFRLADRRASEFCLSPVRRSALVTRRHAGRITRITDDATNVRGVR